MTIQYINTGSSTNAGDGDSLRSAFNKANNNFAYLSTASFGAGGNGYTGSQGDVGYTGSQGAVGVLDDLSDVSVPTPATNDYLKYSQGTWTNSQLSIIGDTAPTLGGNLNLNNRLITSTTGTFVVLRSDTGTGILLQGPVTVGSAASNIDGSLVVTRGTYNPVFVTFAQSHDTADTSNLIFVRTRGSSLNPTSVINGDDLADISFVGHDGVNRVGGASISATVEGTPVIGHIPTKLSFGTDDGTTSLIRAELSASGIWKINKLSSLSTTTSSIVVSTNLVPSQDLTYDLGSTSSQWRSLYVGTSTVYFGGIPLRVTSEGGITVNGVPVAGTGTVQPHLELTNTPFITQPVTLGTDTTITASMRGVDALVDVVIGEGSVIDSITVTTPGLLYVVGQRYRLNYWQVGGNDDADNIDFEVATVGSTGTLLTVANAAFVGTATNTPGTYSNTSIEYRPTEFDEVDTGLTLTRGLYGGLFNSEEEFSYNSSVSPIGTLWNADGWDTLVGFNTRTYDTFDSILTGPDSTPLPELVMWDTINDKYYKFAINVWGVDNNEYSYTRTLITDPNYFSKTNNGNEVDIIVEDDGDGAGIGITRDGNSGIYNPYREGGWDSNNSPLGTLWNIDGWNDLTNIETRTYTNFYAAYGNGQLGNRVPGSKAVMYVPELDKYYAVEWLGWTQNNQGGGFSYIRQELDLTKLTQGITFADGTVQTTAYLGTNVVSTAPGLRRIETASGYNQVSVTQRVTDNYTGVVNATTNGYELRVARTPELDAVLVPINENNTNATFTLSFDNVTFREVWLSSVQATEYWFYYQNDLGQTTPQTEDDPVYLTVTTGGDSVAWWSKNELPGGSDNFRGAVIDYHAYTGDGTIIGTIHIVDDDGEEYITHTEVSSGSTDSMNNDLWIVTTEGTIRYGRFDGEASTLKIHWTAKVFYGDELYD